MCGRFVRNASAREIAELTGVDILPEMAPSYNVAPTQPILAARLAEAGEAQLVSLRWGLIPHWAREARKELLINARSETAATKPAFRDAFKKRRCLVPANGFYEWQRLADGTKLPHFFPRSDGKPYCFAGLWDRWHSPEGETVDSCVILTTDANDLIRPVHDRMPVILAPEDHSSWLEAGPQALLRPCPVGFLKDIPVSSLVNNVRNNTADCLTPL